MLQHLQLLTKPCCVSEQRLFEFEFNVCRLRGVINIISCVQCSGSADKNILDIFFLGKIQLPHKSNAYLINRYRHRRNSITQKRPIISAYLLIIIILILKHIFSQLNFLSCWKFSRILVDSYYTTNNSKIDIILLASMNILDSKQSLT